VALGPNGAGKSTTLKLLTGILVPTAGRATVNGVVPYRQRRQNARQIGAVFGQRSQLWWDLPAIESLRILAAMYDVPAAVYRENLARFEQVLELGAFVERPVRQLSLGQRMRVDLAAALLHNPAVLYLDEPTIGMDVLVKEQVRQFVRRAAQERGTTVVLATHDLRDVEQLCSRVLIIDRGRLMYEGTVASLKGSYGRGRSLVVHFAGAAHTKSAGEIAVEGARLVAWQEGQARFALGAGQNPQPVIADLAARYPIADLSLEEPDLEAIIRELYRHGAADPARATEAALP
jgi:ABC-2 type transport system ATP-binding protein